MALLASPIRPLIDHVYDRVRSFLCKRHKAPGRGTRRFSRDHVYEELGVLRLRRGREFAAVCFAMKSVGKPDAGNPHVRFDERGGETEPHSASPRPSSTLLFANLRKLGNNLAAKHRRPSLATWQSNYPRSSVVIICGTVLRQPTALIQAAKDSSPTFALATRS